MTAGPRSIGRFAGVILGLTFVVVGCAPDRPADFVLDLAERIEDAAVHVEPAVIDFGIESARPHLGLGWHHDERTRPTGDTFVWSRGRESEIFFHLGWVRDLESELMLQPFQFPGSPPQTIIFELNGQSLGEPVTLKQGRHPCRIVLPMSAQVVGRNRLVARYGRVHRPTDVLLESDDERELAVAWSEMLLNTVDSSEVVSNGGVLHLPAGCRMDRFVEPGAGGELRIEACETAGEDLAVLEVSALGEGGETAIETVICNGRGRGVVLGLPDALVRIRLQIRPEDGGGAPNGVEIRNPRVFSSEPPHDVAPPPVADEPPDRRPNVVVYLVDALRVDRLGPYGCERALSPCLDAVAAEGITFTDMTAQSSWTKAAVASIFTGIWPRAHGVNGPDDRLPDGLTTLPEHLHRAGYRTGAVVANAYVGRPFGFARGFDHFEFLELGRSRSHTVGDRVEVWLDDLPDDGNPFFLYVHTIDPHAPYAPPEPFSSVFAPDVEDSSVGSVEAVRGLVLGTVEPSVGLGHDLRQLYDAEVAANDASFGRLLDYLEAMGELDETVVIFTSDHGEAFGEHGSWTHGLDLYNEVLSVPLVVRLPGGADGGRRIGNPVQHIDLLPTILERCGVGGWDELPGRPLLIGGAAIEPAPDRAVLAYLDFWGKHGAAVFRDGWKLIEPLSTDFGSSAELYRHDLDPGETLDVLAESPVRAGWLGARLGADLRRRGESQTTHVAPEVREQLEALGYMH